MNKNETRHKPCKYRKRETRDGVEMDRCYAIGCEEVGDMPCEYCSDWRDDRRTLKRLKRNQKEGADGPAA